MTMPAEDPEASTTQWFDPFPEPHTIPSGWDISGLVPNPETSTDSDTTPESDAESH
jgi:hypothetical protein